MRSQGVFGTTSAPLVRPFFCLCDTQVKELEEQMQGQLNLSMDKDCELNDNGKRLGSTVKELSLLQSSHEELNEKLRCKSTEVDQFQHLYVANASM